MLVASRKPVVRLSVWLSDSKEVNPKCQTPLHGHRLRTCCTTPPTDKLTTILQPVVQQICHIAMPQPYISTCQDVGMWQIFVRWWWICCTISCRIVVSSSVGVLYNTSVAGVRVVEFGTNLTEPSSQQACSHVTITQQKQQQQQQHNDNAGWPE